MDIISHQHSPVLCWIRVLVDLGRDHFTQTSVLREPLACKPAYRMPAYEEFPWLAVCARLCFGNDVWRLAQSC